jgi:hypothetical protein
MCVCVCLSIDAEDGLIKTFVSSVPAAVSVVCTQHVYFADQCVSSPQSTSVFPAGENKSVFVQLNL